MGRTVSYVQDVLGHNILTTDAAGVMTHKTYDGMGRIVQEDLEASDSSSTITTRTTAYDLAGRVVQETDANGKDTFYVYCKVGPSGDAYDAQSDAYFYEETRVYPHRNSDTTWTAPPVQVTWTDSHGNVVRSWTGSSAGTWNASSPPTGGDALTELSRTTYAYDWAGRQIEQRDYHNLASLTKADAGTAGTNFYTNTTEYDLLGRVYQQIDTQGNIAQNEYDAKGRVVKVYAGVDEQSLVQVGEVYYDTNRDGTGDDRSYVTRRRFLKSGVSALTDFATDSTYIDYEEDYDTTNDLKVEWSKPAAGSGPWSRQSSDYMGRALFNETYENGSTTTLLSHVENVYDDAGSHPFRKIGSRIYEVVSGSATANFLQTTYAYEDDTERQVKVTGPSGAFTKVTFDVFGRTARQVAATAEGATDDATSFTDDTVVTEVVYGYDDAGNVIWTETYDRTHDATATGLLSTANDNQRRPRYTATWYDDANRPTHTADYGDQPPQ